MARATVLTDSKVRDLAVNKAKRYTRYDALCPGLLVRIYPSGKKTWMLAARYPGSTSVARRQLGVFGQLLCEAARDKARAWLALLDKGIDPRLEADKERRANQQSAATTFGVVAEEYIRRRVKSSRQAVRTEKEIRAELIRPWGDIPIGDLARSDVVRLVENILDRPKKTPTTIPQSGLYYAHLIFSHCRSIFNYAIERSVYKIDKSPCDRLKPSRIIGAKKPRQRVLSDDYLRAFWAATAKLGYPAGPLYRALLLSGCRLREMSDAQWREMKGQTLVIGRERFKSDAEHVVPITPALRKVLDELPRFKSGDFLFSANWGKSPIGNMGRQKARLDKQMKAELRKLDSDAEWEPWVNHDLRRCVKSHLSALRFPDHVSEMALGHGRKGLQRIYDRHRYEAEIRECMEAWAKRLLSIVESQAEAREAAE